MSIRPNRLRKDDTICVVSPSALVGDAQRSNLTKGINKLKELGFEVTLSKHALSNTLGYSATAREKAQDINDAFADNTIKAIIFSQGGRNTNSTLPFLDYKLIKNNPKILLGISDATVLLNAIYEKTGLITFHGNDVMWGFGNNPIKYDIDEFLHRLVDGANGVINKNSEWKTIRDGDAEGILIGGNMNCLTKLLGTPYNPNYNDKILFLEDFGEGRPADTASYEFHQLEQAGIFKQIKGLWFGYYKTPGSFNLEEIAMEVVGKYKFPVIKCNDFGHNTPNTVIPIGVKVKLDGNKSEIEILEDFMV